MNQRLSRIMAVGILAALLALPTAAWAAPAHPRGAAGAWSWFAGLLEKGASFLLDGIESALDPNPGSGLKGGSDPDGVNIQGFDGSGQGRSTAEPGTPG